MENSCTRLLFILLVVCIITSVCEPRGGFGGGRGRSGRGRSYGGGRGGYSKTETSLIFGLVLGGGFVLICLVFCVYLCFETPEKKSIKPGSEVDSILIPIKGMLKESGEINGKETRTTEDTTSSPPALSPTAPSPEGCVSGSSATPSLYDNLHTDSVNRTVTDQRTNPPPSYHSKDPPSYDSVVAQKKVLSSTRHILVVDILELLPYLCSTRMKMFAAIISGM